MKETAIDDTKVPVWDVGQRQEGSGKGERRSSEETRCLAKS